MLEVEQRPAGNRRSPSRTACCTALQSNPTEKDLAKGGASRSRKSRPVISTLRHRSAAAAEISIERSVRAGSGAGVGFEAARECGPH